jgi:hypothetical protein
MKTALLASLLLLAPLAASADGLPEQAYIAVSGHGELQVAPDLAYVYVSLEKTGLDAKVARADVESRAAKVIALARKLGIADKDIDAPSVSVVPQYEWVEERDKSDNDSAGTSKRVYRLAGQHVSRSVVLTLRDLSRYGELADGLFAAGVTDLGNVSMDRSDREALQQKARALAVGDARDHAAGLAQSAGVNLGAVYSITEQGGGGFRPQRMMPMSITAGASSTAPEYLNGKIEISADVSVLYLIGK